MPSPEERLPAVEAQVQDQTHALVEIRNAIRHLEQRMDARFVGINTHFTSINSRFTSIDSRFTSIDARFDGIDRRLDRLDDKVSKQFIWTVSIQLTVLIAIVSALAAMLGVVVSRA